jgi:hypothetical protein
LDPHNFFLAGLFCVLHHNLGKFLDILCILYHSPKVCYFFALSKKSKIFFCTMMHEKTEKTAKNRPRGHFQKKRTSFRWLIKGATPISYP